MGMLLFGIGLITLGSVIPGLQEKFALDTMASATLFFILPLGILIGSLTFGPLCDLYGYRLLLTTSALCMCLGFEGIAFATSLTVLKACILVFGVGGGAINGATNAVVADISGTGKSANLSLLGVFYGIGAFGMPFMLGMLSHRFRFEGIVAGVGVSALVIAIWTFLTRFPMPKQKRGFPLMHSLSLVKDQVLLLIAFFLFCQSSFEGIINNWTTTYLTGRAAITGEQALYALSLFVVGMTVMRLLLGSVFRRIPPARILYASFVLILLACGCLRFFYSLEMAMAGLVLLGAGLAAGFPVMLGLVGERFRELSATAFSLVLAVALVGNMLVNYAMGYIARHYGISQLITVSVAEWLVMVILAVSIFRKLKTAC